MYLGCKENTYTDLDAALKALHICKDSIVNKLFLWLKNINFIVSLEQLIMCFNQPKDSYLFTEIKKN